MYFSHSGNGHTKKCRLTRRSPRQRMPAGTVFLLASREGSNGADGYSTEAGGAKFEGSNVIVTIGVGFAQM